MPGSNSRPKVSEGYEVPLSYRGDRYSTIINSSYSTIVVTVLSCVERTSADSGRKLLVVVHIYEVFKTVSQTQSQHRRTMSVADH